MKMDLWLPRSINLPTCQTTETSTGGSAAVRRCWGAGTILLAKEGINGTICALAVGMNTILEWLAGEPALALSLKFSSPPNWPFYA